MDWASGRHSGPLALRGEMRARLFGPLDIRVGGVPVIPLTSRRGRSLLGNLVLHRDTAQSRQALAFLLWPDSSEDQARTNLRNLLHTLRRAVPEIDGCLSITNRTVQWRPDARLWVDVDEFTLATEAAGRAAPGSDEMVDALRTAVSLYTGDLLEDCYDDWVAAHRQRLRDSHVSALRRLTAALGDRGDYAEAIRLGRELVRMEPVEEENHRLLMSLHDAAGDRAAAVRTFHECAAVLGRELGIAPGATTRRLHEAVRAGDSSPAGDAVPAVAPATIVGREREWAELTRRWQDAEGGRAQFVVVTGEPGVGKSRLIEELAAWCRQGEAVVCRARSYLTEGELGWGTVAAWLRTPEVAARVRRSTPNDVAQLSRIVPDLGPAASSTAEDSIPVDRGDDAGGGERRRVFDAAARAIMSTGKAVLLVVDDAQWCDVTSLQFVHYLLRHYLHDPLLVVASARREDIDERHPFTALLDGLTMLGRTSEIPLHRLTREDTAALASQLLGRVLDSGTVSEIYASTEGNPLFVVETVRGGAGGPFAGHTGTPPRLQAVIRGRLAQLSEPAHDLLDLAATVGREFRADLISHALGVDDITVASSLDELWRRGLIREHDVDAYDFSHGKIREVTYEALGPASRRANHLRVAEGLQRLFANDAARVSGQIATHYDRAGRTDEAVAWYREAATQAQRMSAYTEAVRFLERASELLAAHSAPEALARRLEVVSALPTAVIGLEGFASDRLAEVQRIAVEMATGLGVEPNPPVLRSLVLSSLCRDAFDEAHAAANRLSTSAEAGGDDGMLVESRYLLGVVSFWSGQLDAAREHFEAVVERFAPQDQETHLLRFGHDPKVVCQSRLANTLAFLGFDDEARRARDAALALADEVGHPYSRDVTLVFAALVALDLGDDDGVRACAARLAARADQGGPIRINAAAWPAYVEVLDGRAEAGIGRIRTALADCGDRNPAPGFRATLYRLLVAAHVAADDLQGGLAATEDALAAAGTRIWETEIRRARATFLAALGDRAGAATELDRAEVVARLTGSLGPLRRIVATRVRLCPTG